MNFSLPYSRKRRYLTGIDWIVGSLNHDARQGAGAGAISQTILDLEGSLSEHTLRAALNLVSHRFPLIHGRVSRDWFNLAPFWRIPRSARSATIPIRVIDLAPNAQAEAERLLVDHVNAPLDSETQHLRFLIVRLGKEQTKLGMVFDHRLLDAFGAEALLRLIDLAWQGRLDEVAPKVKTTEPAHLDHWPRRFRSGKTLNQLFYRIREREVCALPMPAVGGPRRVRFVHESLTLEESAAFNLRAGAEIGVPIILPSAAARAVLAMRKVFPSTPLPGEQFLLFTTVTTRAPNKEWESLFFNPFAFLTFAADNGPVPSTPTLAAAFRDQFFELMKLGVPAAMHDAAALGRIFPHWLISKVAREIGKGRLCSLYFACIRESGFPCQSFLGHSATNLIHTPLAFSPPGLNVCMTYFANRFNLVVAYTEGSLSDTQAAEILQEFKSLLRS